MMTCIELQKISISHGKVPLIDDLSLCVEQGETFALLGINGAGKSSIVKAILDFIDIDSGEILIQGKGHSQPQSRQPLAFIPEKFTPPYYSTGQQFIDFTLAVHAARQSPSLVLHYCELLGLNASCLKQPIQSYSKGMCQKLGLIAVLAANKSLYILDEPMSGLDPIARARLCDVFAQLKAEGKSLLFCTHMLADVAAVCDRIGILHRGQLSFVGSPSECCEQFNAPNLEQAFLRTTNFSAAQA